MVEALSLLLPDGVSVAGSLLLVFASFFTSALTAAAGVGGGLTLLALMTYLVPIPALIPVHGTVQFGSNAGRAWLMRGHAAWPLLAAFLAGALPGAFFGRYAVGFLPDAGMKALLGIFILILTWIRLPQMAGIGRRGFAATGLVTTFMTMIFGATGPFVAVVLSKAFDDRLKLVGTMAALMTCQHLIKVVVFALSGFAFGTWLPLMAAMIFTGFAGTWTGRHLLLRLPERTFRLIFNVALSVLALDLVRRGLGY